MSNIAVLGAAFGDEGKGSITHNFSKDYDWVIRFSGGANAGHTIYRDGIKYVHNLIPSFDWRSPQTKAFLGSGMVIDLEQLHKEVAALSKIDRGIPHRIYVDPEAFVVLPEHKEEDKQLNGHIGSTNRGIGPAYRDKFARKGVRIIDYLSRVNNSKDDLLLMELEQMGVHFKNVLELENTFKKDRLLFEGAQGILLDINHGVYPYVSCGDATVAGIYACGFHFAPPEHVYGVAKCYTTKVGEGPFPTEIHGEEAETLRKMGNEYGATTGRPRRVGWIDLPALKYAKRIGGIDSLILTKFDILNGMPKVKVCTDYRGTPHSAKNFFNTEVWYVNADGWKDAKDISQLKNFLSLVHSVVAKVSYISCGTSPEDIISLI
jgi:adenylosuccinate synthase